MTQPRGSQRTGDYLEALYGLLFPVGDFRPADAAAPIAARVAERLGVSRASASEMLKRLDEQGFIAREGGRTLSLTEEGIALAEHGVRAVRVIETFLVDLLGYAPSEVHARAREMRDAFDPDMLERLHQRIGAPARCPHGWPIGDEAATDGLARLDELQVGEKAQVFGIVEDEPELVDWLFRVGLVPGAGVRVREVARAAGHVTVGIGRGDDVVVADRAARGVFVTA